MATNKIYIDAQPFIVGRTGIGWYAYSTIFHTLKQASDDVKICGTVYDFLGRLNAEEVLDEVGFEHQIVRKYLHPRIYKLLWAYAKVKYDNIFMGGNIYHYYNYIVPPISKDKKVVINVYDMVYKKYPETMKASNLYLLNRDLERSIKRADHIITISESAKRDILEYFPMDGDKITVLPPGIDYEFFKQGQNISQEKAENIKEKYKLPDKFFLYLGTIEPRKNLKTVFDAYAKLPESIRKEYKIVLAGGVGWKAQEIMDYPKELGIEDAVLHIGYIDEEDKPFIYGLAGIFLFPSIYEGFGMPVSEALASGTPVITSDNSSLPEAGGDGASYVSCMDYDAMSKEMIKYVEDEQYRKQKVKQGIDHVLTLSWKDNAKKTLEIYKDLGGK